ncbi:hypothetical protein ACTWPT_08220 [Nonomuraea sp. 3N208]|uniref:hypothetical protein n=1 Tax=Nonomuraea sp. 3N208 TaxID=3457421 RepID=UPI003FCC9D23
MSFGTYARRVRDPSLPYGLRYSSLRCAVARYMPLGFHATWDFVTSRAGNVRRDEAALLRALGLLEDSRRAWHAEQAGFARRRTEDKRRHHRTATEEERRHRFGWRWHGEHAHEAAVRAVATLWKEHLEVASGTYSPAESRGSCRTLRSPRRTMSFKS